MVIVLSPVHEPRKSKVLCKGYVCLHLGQQNPSLQIGHANNYDVCVWRRIKKGVCMGLRVHCNFPHPSLISSLFTKLSSSLSFPFSLADLRKCFWMVLSELILEFRSEGSVFLFPSQSGNTKPQFVFILRFAKNHLFSTYFKFLFFWEENTHPVWNQAKLVSPSWSISSVSRKKEKKEKKEEESWKSGKHINPNCRPVWMLMFCWEK